MDTVGSTPAQLQLATFGGGCFWCTEAVFSALAGVEKVVPGYMGGTVKNPTYRLVCTGTTGHAEVIQISYDPAKITYVKLLEVFFHTHDPTTLNRQGNDVGTQYRSVIFPHTEQQKDAAEELIQRLNEAKAWPNPVVTTVEPLATFYPAEDYHRDYFAQHGHEPYCQMVIRPKMEKFRKAFRENLK
ncbi:peptide-methionine (S)-S-oxide reductase MsrA [Planctomicrobium sp. SH661]|uniref:peptide-methionine (S)-S-oxide reductase MsrA n=1 Tax=Planctomicrobium sp. SH661 TaxID=3448124 RepID=UPI003F5BFA47